MNRVLSSLLGVLLLFTGSAWADKPLAPTEIPGAVKVSAEKTVDLIASRQTLLVFDSRRKDEFDKGHIEGAINLLDTEMTLGKLEKFAPQRDTPLLFYCNGQHCLRSGNAAKLALHWGYRNVFWFRGGWQEWSDSHLPVAR